MNHNAKPFQPSITMDDYLRQIYKSINLVVQAPFAPIKPLTPAQKRRMHIQQTALYSNMTHTECEGLAIAISVAESVLQ